jgi:hypothetical protein
MKSLVLAIALGLSFTTAFAAETKKVCVEQKDSKTGKMKEVCKNVKQHKKLEGTKVPDKK